MTVKNNSDIQMTILKSSVKMLAIDLLKSKSDEYRAGWWAAWEFFSECNKRPIGGLINAIENIDAFEKELEEYEKILIQLTGGNENG
jgi:hypothetical protein